MQRNLSEGGYINPEGTNLEYSASNSYITSSILFTNDVPVTGLLDL